MALTGSDAIRDVRRYHQCVNALMRLVMLGGVIICGCNGLTDVNAPDIVQPSDLANARGADALRAGATSAFAIAYAGTTPVVGTSLGQISASGLLADEFSSSATQINNLGRVADSRLIAEPSYSYPYPAVQRARTAASDAILALQHYTPAAHARIGELFALAGYTELFLGEDLCSGIPLGRIVDGRPEFGRPLTTVELFEHAAADFDSALSYSADSTRITNLAKIGRARALLNLGRFADGKAAVSAIATTYVYDTEHGLTVQPNGLYDVMNNAKSVSVADREGMNGLDFRAAADPRVPTRLVGKSSDGVDVYTFTRYTSLSSPVPLATGIEARLIEAEAMLQSGDAPSELAALNALRATIALSPLSDAGTDAARVDQLFRERAFWLFGTGHRQGDLRRMIRQYSRSAESVFPTGSYSQGGEYGSEVTFTPDASQTANPQYEGCLSREP